MCISAPEFGVRRDAGRREIAMTEGDRTGRVDCSQQYGPAMRELRRIAQRAARSRMSILILGETGVGKDVLARAIHQWSPRASSPFLPINCSALPSSLVDSELCGHERGAFTGAASARSGLLELANGGTVFLDELGELPLGTQSKLLRVVEDRIVTPLGRGKPRSLDVRFVGATNRNIEAAIQAGTFRDDLFYRLGAVVLRVPPLRERREEIAALTKVALDDAGAELGEEGPSELSSDALRFLESRPWPGNIRELTNVIRRACLLADGPTITLSEVQRAIDDGVSGTTAAGATDENLERTRISQVLSSFAGNQTKAANALGMPRRTFIARLDRYNLPRPQKIALAVGG
jgi:DNA-binding NtrC family response regulator